MPTTQYLLLENDFIWLEAIDQGWQLPGINHAPNIQYALPLLVHDNYEYSYAQLSEIPAHFKRVHLRACIELLGLETFQRLGKAKQLWEWQQNHRYCGHCGTATHSADHDRARQCPKCLLMAYPRIAPCVLVAVHRPGELLLARSAHFPKGVYSILAGFIEIGENAEQCCQREVFEEVGLEIDTPIYCDSQPWPFPHQLMLAYRAAYVQGELRIDYQELEDAQWFKFSQLPPLPQHHTLAYQVIHNLIGTNNT